MNEDITFMSIIECPKYPLSSLFIYGAISLIYEHKSVYYSTTIPREQQYSLKGRVTRSRAIKIERLSGSGTVLSAGRTASSLGLD